VAALVLGTLLQALSLAPGAPPVAAGGSPSAAAVRAKLARIRAQIERERALRALHERQQAQAQAAFTVALTRFSQARSELAALGQRLAALGAREGLARARLAAAERAAAVARRRLRATEIGWQEEGALGPLAILLGAPSLDAFFSRLYMVDELIGYQGVQMRQLSEALARAAREERIVAAQVRAIAAAEARARVAAATIQREGAVERAAMAHDAALVQADSGALEQLEEASANLVQILEQERHASTVAPAAVGQALHDIRFQWPVVGPITSPFGMRLDPVMHQWWLHTGIDIGVPEGTPVHAACGGSVLYSGWMTGYGNVVIIDCGNGISTLYAHAESLLVHVGETVSQGQEIDLAGMTGWATGPHVHFEIRVNGKPINPLPYLPGG
jgi:murein DD-endopeptidase MepM/ murein hydrolase activator NlpD